MRQIKLTAQFEKDVKLARKRHSDMDKLSDVIKLLGKGDLQDIQFKDHPLKGKYKGLRECHISPDWLLVYLSSEEQVILVRTGAYSDLFR